ncbi:cardiolipin synthase [Shinella yambaruensis]|uniref:Cardiolipin synthase n=1 Tax=Shinella yambaruensis TaxID=415996 RepID=A0ABQ5ZEP9_9HYPH|nr:cardiolipin synthase [Shinella yambaruensis]MCJ8029670.1 cardiolipin synthase [Shinella yambaruensis]MCU7984399.1 cardiolipin synthase [Shinella yambaruensis]GLR50120.1 cardiolipin synthase A [Shinella yambaruensis]
MVFMAVHILVVAVAAAHILLRPHRQPESRAAWLVLVLTLPYLGALAYLLVGQTNVGRKRVERLRAAFLGLPRPQDAPGWHAVPRTPDRHEALFAVGRSISGYLPVGGNSARLMEDSNAAIDAMVKDIDAAGDHVHLLFYIWLADRNGTKVAEAVQRAARRGVACRVLVDDLGSRDLVRGPLWRDMAAAGAEVRRALVIGNPLLRALTGRIDLRNHRKIAVIDNRITYCGSQNCADPEFLPKRKFAPWVDVLMRFEGPVVRQNQHLFASDWMGNGGGDISDLLRRPMEAVKPGFTAQVIATGPTFRNSAMPEMFESLIYAAKRSLFITTPYYVPDAAMQAALCACANRGVDTTLVFPARNDDFAVAAASRSYYSDLLHAGVKIFEYEAGLLHAKTLTMDGEITLIGSANMDRRSFDLNYENNILVEDADLTATLRARQETYLTQCLRILPEEVGSWGIGRRLWNNALAIVGPLL